MKNRDAFAQVIRDEYAQFVLLIPCMSTDVSPITYVDEIMNGRYRRRDTLTSTPTTIKSLFYDTTSINSV